MKNSNYRIVFLGSPQAGKSTLMSAWFHLLVNGFAGELDSTSETAGEFEAIYQQWTEQALDPTIPGKRQDITVNASYKDARFAIRMQDFSGEDLLDCFVDEELKEGSANAETVEAIRAADWIFHVVNPEHVLSNNQKDQFNPLFFAKRLPQILGNNASLKHVTTLLSKSDVVESELIKKAKGILTENQSPEYLTSKDVQEISAIPETTPTEPNKIRLESNLQTIINNTISTFISVLPPPPPPPGRPLDLIKKLAIWAGVVSILLAFLLILLNLIGPPPTEPAWDKHLAVFDEIEKNATSGPPVSYSKAQNLLENLVNWENEASEIRGNKLDEMQGRIGALKSKLESVSPPQGSDRISELISDLLDQHSPANLKNFYAALSELAGNQMDNPAWSTEARTAWKEIFRFCESLESGITIRLGSCSFSADQWWTSIVGFTDSKLQIWDALKGDPRPFDDKTATAAPLETEWVKPVWDKDIKKWSCTFIQNNPRTLKIGLDTQLWLRAYGGQNPKRTLVDIRIPRRGPLGLDWFGKQQVDRKLNSQLNVRVIHELVVPESISKAFREYRASF